jgi:hypothetical protein
MSLHNPSNHIGICKYFVGLNELSTKPVVALTDFVPKLKNGPLKRKIAEIDSPIQGSSTQGKFFVKCW